MAKQTATECYLAKWQHCFETGTLEEHEVELAILLVPSKREEELDQIKIEINENCRQIRYQTEKLALIEFQSGQDNHREHAQWKHGCKSMIELLIEQRDLKQTYINEVKRLNVDYPGNGYRYGSPAVFTGGFNSKWTGRRVLCPCGDRHM